MAGHDGAADWDWARRAQEVVGVPVVVNGDVRCADDVARALRETGCAGVMIGRAAIHDPWIFRQAKGGPPPTAAERVALYRAIVDANIAARGAKWGVEVSRRHMAVLGAERAAALRPALLRAATVDAVSSVLLG